MTYPADKQHSPRALADEAKKAHDFYNVHRGMTNDSRVVPDLYATIARLARIVERQQTELEKLRR